MENKKILNSNDIQFLGICPNILLYSDRYTKFELCKYNVMLSDIEIVNDSTAITYLNCLIYRCIEEYLSNVNGNINRIHTKYNRLVAHIDSKYSKYVIKGWIFYLRIVKMIEEILENYDEIYSNVVYLKNSVNPSLQFSLKIDAILRRKNEKEINILTLVPNVPGNITLDGMSSIDTSFALEFLNESGMDVFRIHEIKYNIYEEYLGLNNIRSTPTIVRYQKQVCDSINNNHKNLLMCANCTYRNSCRISDRLR